MAKGDHLEVSRGAYAHHAIDLGDGTVVHFAGGKLGNAQIRRDPLVKFHKGRPYSVVRYNRADTFSSKQTCHIAKKLVKRFKDGKIRSYDLMDNNCEHLATFCKTGSAYSIQALNGRRALGVILATIRLAVLR